MNLTHVITFLVGMLGGIPGSYFGILWWTGRSKREVTPRRRALLADIRRNIDDARREIAAVKGDFAPRASAIDHRLSLLRAAPEDHVLRTPTGAETLCRELGVCLMVAQQISAMFLVMEPLSLAAFDAHTLHLSFNLTQHEEGTGR